MNLFDGHIQAINNLLVRIDGSRKVYNDVATWKRVDKNPFLMVQDSALEMGGYPKESTNALAFTSNDDLIPEGRVSIYGDSSLYNPSSKHISYGKIVLLKVKDIPDDKMYDTLKEIEFLEYKLHLEDVMVRSSSEKSLTNVRIGKKAFGNKNTLAMLGNAYSECFEQHPFVEKAHTIILVGDVAIYKAISEQSVKIKELTIALNTIVNENLMVECGSCSLKSLCDEVDVLREYHMGKK